MLKNLIVVFVLILISSVLGIFILYPLLVGLVLFMIIAVKKGWPLRSVLQMILSGALKVIPILQIFLLIGIMIGLWFSSGTIAGLVYYGVSLMVPQLFILFAFVLCSIVSLLIGTSFGTIGTVGMVLLIMSRMGNVESVFVVGAIIAGAYVGDRISPMSSSAHLVATVTRTKIYENVRNMNRTMWLPFGISCFLYLILSLHSPLKISSGNNPLLEQIPHSFHLTPWVFLPIVVLIVMIARKTNVKWAMAASAATALVVTLTTQAFPAQDLLRTFAFGFFLPEQDPLHAIFQGGGIQFMIRPTLVVIVSSAFTGIFSRTDMVLAFEHKIAALAHRAGRFSAAILTSILTASLGCTQTLSIIMTHHFLHSSYEKQKATPEELALDIEDTAVLLSVMIPWNVAGAIPAQMLGLDARFVPFAFFLYLVPLIRWLKSRRSSNRDKSRQSRTVNRYTM